MPDILELDVEELVRRSTQGATSPWISRLSDDNTYYIKGVQALHKGLIIEYLCAQLGRSLGIPIPSTTIAYLDMNLLRYNSEAKKDFGEESCYVFASQEVKSLTELKVIDLESMNPQVAKLLFFFDYLIQNEDRMLTENGGNPNLFINPINSDMTVFDHNLAFDVNYDFENNKNFHACREFWYEAQLELNFKHEMLEQLPIAIAELAEYAKGIPQEWLDSCDGLLNEIFTKLNLYKTALFWEALQ
ncbi:hypothetical protein HWV01_17930 [Moritella sp. 5]|uniref:HipA family kinase n=1 Tax=Moritella sp. 5 TaxID=2746231 RepID=UPI001BABFB26|nr:HipA family kinase [Moritella sp. 5]QUM82025.1 hypothetical protein HWV01_17930 [Moritella sp. 5]